MSVARVNLFLGEKRVLLRHYLGDRTARPGAHSTAKVRSKKHQGPVVEAALAPLLKGGGGRPRAVRGCVMRSALAGATRSDKEYDAVGAAFGAFVIRSSLAGRVAVATNKVGGARR